MPAKRRLIYQQELSGDETRRSSNEDRIDRIEDPLRRVSYPQHPTLPLTSMVA